MRSVIVDDEAFAHLIGEGGLYDYELGEKYIVAPGPSNEHGQLQGKVLVVLAAAIPEHVVSGPTNLGRLGEPGERWYVVPDVIVFAAGAPRGVDASLDALIAVEVRSPREDAARKLADYRTVAERTGLDVGEVWYVADGEVSVHPRASDDVGPTAFPEALAAVRQAVHAWSRPT